MPRGRPTPALVVTAIERQELATLARRARSRPAVARRARIVLAYAAGLPNTRVARQQRVTPATVGKWRQRFVTQRVAGLFDEPRPGAPSQSQS